MVCARSIATTGNGKREQKRTCSCLQILVTAHAGVMSSAVFVSVGNWRRLRGLSFHQTFGPSRFSFEPCSRCQSGSFLWSWKFARGCKF